MKTDITPADSVCPIFLEPQDPEQVAADLAAAEARAAAKAVKAAAKQDVLDRLGITAEEAALLLGA
jgi:hypothetical protein